jgi:3-hydroxyisobutyrate dehydrogenase
MRLGFIGLGRMGEPIALNLVRAGHRLQVWNRSRPAVDRLLAVGATAGQCAGEILHDNSVTFIMLADEAVTDQVLKRGSDAFARKVKDRLIVQMGTTSPAFSIDFGREVADAGGRYVEAPVSGSRGPAEEGALVAMLAGEKESIEQVSPLFRPIAGQVFECGAVPGALRLKLAVNLFLITMVAGLAEAIHFAERTGVDIKLLQEVLDAGPMASVVSRTKLAKHVSDDVSPQASIADVLMNSVLVSEAARASGASTRLLDGSRAILETCVATGHGGADMIALVRGIEAEADRLRLAEERG